MRPGWPCPDLLICYCCTRATTNCWPRMDKPFTLNPHYSVVQHLLRATNGTLEMVHVSDDEHV